MTEHSRIPLSVMRGYKPDVIRYVWYVKAQDGDGNVSEHCGFTHGGITNITGRLKKDILELKVADLKRSKVFTINDIDTFTQEWGANYLDPAWRIPRDIRDNV